MWRYQGAYEAHQVADLGDGRGDTSEESTEGEGRPGAATAAGPAPQARGASSAGQSPALRGRTAGRRLRQHPRCRQKRLRGAQGRLPQDTRPERGKSGEQGGHLLE